MGHPHPTSECLALCPCSAPIPSFMLIYTFGGNDQSWLKYLCPWQPEGRFRLKSQLLPLVWNSPHCCGHLGSKLAHEQSPSLCVPLPCKLDNNQNMFYIKKIVQNIEEENRSLLVKSVKVLKIPWEAENWNHQNNEIHSNRDQSQRAQKILSAVLVSYIGTSSRLFHFWSNSLLNAWESNEGWPRSLSPLTHVRNPGETPGFCSQIGSAWDSAAKGREPTDGDLCACLSLKSTSQIKNKWEPKATWTTVSPKHRKPVESIHKSVPGWDREMWSLTHWDYFCENGVQYPCPGEHQWCKLLSVFSSPLKGFV